MNITEDLRIQTDLIRKINAADKAYWVDGKPAMPDHDYDKLMHALKTLEESNPKLSRTGSPTQRLGGGLLEDFDQVKHVRPMLSLDNIFDLNELESRLRDWWEKGARRFVIEPKIDGLAMEVKYTRGNLSQALNRGNGEFGSDMTENVKTIRSIPLTAPNQVDTARVRGEVFMTFADFKKLNETAVAEGREPYKNPRAAANGAIKLLDSCEVAKRRLSFIPYHFSEGFDKLKSQTELHAKFAELGFPPLPMVHYADSIEDAIDYVVKFEALKRDLPFPADGAVVKIDDFAVRKHYNDSSRAVRWGYAYKYAPEEAETILKRIIIQVGRTGALAPVADLEPVDLDGTTVSRATLHNEGVMQDLGVYPGCKVIIAKAGEIIPICCKVTEAAYTCPICNYTGTLKEQNEKHQTETR